MDHEVLSHGVPGNYVGFHNNKVPTEGIRQSYVAGDSKNDPPKGAASLTAQLFVLDLPGQITGYTAVLDCHTANIRCKFDELLERSDGSNGKLIESSPKCIKPGNAAIVEIVPQKPVCVEPFRMHPSLGCSTVRDGGQIHCCGHY